MLLCGLTLLLDLSSIHLLFISVLSVVIVFLNVNTQDHKVYHKLTKVVSCNSFSSRRSRCLSNPFYVCLYLDFFYNRIYMFTFEVLICIVFRRLAISLAKKIFL